MAWSETPADGESRRQQLIPVPKVTAPVLDPTSCRIVKDRLRLWKQGVRDQVMEICCALHNLRVRLTPWQPVI